MIGLHQIEVALESITYKPGWKFTPYEHKFEGVWLSIEVKLEDSYHPGQLVDLNIRTAIPPCVDELAFFNWLLYRIIRIESHEAREWFKVSGTPWKDPHANGANE